MTEKAMFAAGCFWGVQDAFNELKSQGVIDTTVGYAGGHKTDPTYEEVCKGQTDHREVVLVEFDPDQISFETLLDTFWECHDPSYPNDGGEEVEVQYRSAVFYFNEGQKQAATLSKQKVIDQNRFQGPVVTDILEQKPFYRAEDVHQNFNQLDKVCSRKRPKK